VRLSSIEATEVTRELISVMAERPERVCPHLHISMQSGSDAVLARMCRRWGSRRFVDRCRMFQDALPQPAITTDIIVGFPGETEADFTATCDVARAVGFSKIHIFPFSPRRGTPAADMPNQVPPQIKAERVARLATLEVELRDRYFSSLRGRTLRILVESASSPGHVAGTSCRYAPVDFLGGRELVGQFADVTAGAIVEGRTSAM
jgi:threonylcarbamoyladenosine tRNA methylthiotransferase MtaB